MSSGKAGAEGTGPFRPGDEARPGTPGTGENMCPECKGTGKIIEGIGGA